VNGHLGSKEPEVIASSIHDISECVSEITTSMTHCFLRSEVSEFVSTRIRDCFGSQVPEVIVKLFN